MAKHKEKIKPMRKDLKASGVAKKCESCSLKTPVYGMPAEGRRRWCSSSAA